MILELSPSSATGSASCMRARSSSRGRSSRFCAIRAIPIPRRCCGRPRRPAASTKNFCRFPGRSRCRASSPEVAGLPTAANLYSSAAGTSRPTSSSKPAIPRVAGSARPPMPDALLKLEHVSKVFESGGIFQSHGKVTAVDDVTLDVWPGETLGIVGESGSGKSTLLRPMLRLLRPTSGRVLFEGADVWSLPARQLRRLRSRMQAVFQDPASSFNPRQSIAVVLAAPLEVHAVGTRADHRAKVAEALDLVGL